MRTSVLQSVRKETVEFVELAREGRERDGLFFGSFHGLVSSTNLIWIGHVRQGASVRLALFPQLPQIVAFFFVPMTMLLCVLDLAGPLLVRWISVLDLRAKVPKESRRAE